MQGKAENNVTKKDVNQAPTGEKSTGTDREASASPEKSREQLVREAAYRRFEARGSEHGRHEQDWLDAEREVKPPEGN